MTIKNYVTHATGLTRSTLAVTGVLAASGLLLISGTAAAAASTSSTSSTTNQQHLQNIIAKGDAEITRRLATLSALTSKVNAATKLSANDKTTLSNEVAATTSGLTTLKTQLDAETTVGGARTDVQNIYNEYRVYALVAPKINLIKVADDQQVVEGKLSSLALTLQGRITADQKAGKNVATLQSQLSDMQSQTQAAQAISSNIESVVINLQPSDYNSNHAVLSGDNNQLKTTHADNQAAYADAKNIVSELKNL